MPHLNAVEKVTGFIKAPLRSSNLRNSALVFLGKSFGLVFLLISNVIIARHLKPEAFGVFSISFMIMTVAGRALSGGIDAGLVKFYAQFSEIQIKTSFILRIAFLSKLLIQAIVLVLGYVMSPYIAVLVLGDSSYAHLITLSFVGALCLALFESYLAQLQAKKIFKHFVVLDMSSNLMKIVSIVALMQLGALNVHSAMLAYVLISLMFLLIASSLFSKDILLATPYQPDVLKEFIRFTKWMFLTTALLTIARRLGTFILGYFRSSEEVGYYSAAFNIILPVELLLTSLIIVVFPSVARMKMKKEFKRFFKELLSITIPLGVVILIGTFYLGRFLITTVYSEIYLQSVILLKVFMVGIVVSLIANPFGLIPISLGNPRLVALVEAISLVIILIGSVLVASRWGAVGVAVIYMIARFVAGCLFINSARTAIAKCP